MPLVDYGSSSSEDDDGVPVQENKAEPTGHSQAKRVLPTAETTCVLPKRTKVALPPLPSSLTDLFKDRERPPDDPEKHQGRVRTRPHIDGSWAVHVYLEVKLSSELFDIISILTKTIRKSVPSAVSLLQSIESLKDKKGVALEAETAADASELHISLTRPLYLQELHIGRFTSDVRDAFKNKKKFNISFSGVQSFSNDERSRSFLSLRVGSGHAEIEGLLAEMDVIAERYCQQRFYDNPQFHASFAWAIGGDVLNEKTVATMTEIEGELGHDLRHCSVTVRRVAWKTGLRFGSLLLQ
ncbi:poly(U)-specific 3'-to-5' RNA exonuclease [Modicella reniformis]|uniref:U6 snRNA phosphodiesterase n=1 Tax=Modicella reniformis TaxID=1440133 RepID=A0A9P6J0W3_9FUNG|nr:poly(U)-specific 3'-to-5' RNA exonuclease [Modicella reniformis]